MKGQYPTSLDSPCMDATTRGGKVEEADPDIDIMGWLDHLNSSKVNLTLSIATSNQEVVPEQFYEKLKRCKNFTKLTIGSCEATNFPILLGNLPEKLTSMTLSFGAASQLLSIVNVAAFNTLLTNPKLTGLTTGKHSLSEITSDLQLVKGEVVASTLFEWLLEQSVYAPMANCATPDIMLIVLDYAGLREYGYGTIECIFNNPEAASVPALAELSNHAELQ